MAMLSSQIILHLWKHQILMRRRIIQTLCELIFPAFLLFLIAFILSYAEKAAQKNDFYEFNSVSLNGAVNDLDSKIQFIPTFRYVWDCGNEKSMTLVYSSEPACKKYSEMIMNRLKGWYDGGQTEFGTRHFDNIEKMKEVLANDLNSSYESCHKFIGGIHFSKIVADKQTAELNYVIMLPRSNKISSWTMKHIEDFWRQIDHDEAGDRSDIPGDPPYWSSGFLSLQYAIDRAFIGLANNDSLDDVELRLHRLPVPPAEISAATALVPLCLTLFLFVFANYMLKDIAIERDSGIMTYMSVMGLNQFAFYGSHFLIATMKMLPFVVTLSAISVYNEYIKYIEPSLFITLCVLFGVLVLLLALFLGILFKKFTQIGPFFVIAALWLLPIVFEVDVNNVPLCLLASLNPFYAFSMAIHLIVRSEKKMLRIDWSLSSMFASASTQFTIGTTLLMFLLDFLLFSLLAFYFALVSPAEGSPKNHPLFFLKFCGFNKFFAGSSELYNGTETKELDIQQNENVQSDCASLGDEADIVVNEMCKKWPSVAQFSIDCLSFKAFRGQITVLLGRNGAGKSTTFSVLTGMLNYNAGQVLICGTDLKQQLRQCQNKIGFCPQYNPLFYRLTVKEHLKFYAATKSGYLNGPHGKAALDQEICTVASELGIEPLLNMQSHKLSGGQKRKLCVAIALIAHSRVVLLDEPSAGMDPEARIELGQMLRNIKQDRTILLTTHYMEEADILGDRIVIISNGRLVCNGSPQFLKHRFGTGYVLTIIINIERIISRSNTDAVQKYFKGATAAVFAIIRKHSPDSYIENTQEPPEFTVILPLKDKKHYAALFKELEQLKGEHKPIKSFGLSMNSLEQVFLRVNEFADSVVNARGVDSVDGSTKLAEDLFGLRQQQFLKGTLALVLLWVHQIRALLCRHLLWSLRNPFSSFGCFVGTLLAFLVPIVLLYNSKPYNRVSRSLSPATISEYISIPLHSETAPYSKSFNELANKIPFANKIWLSSKNQSAVFIDHLYEMYPMVIGASEYQNDSKTVVEALFSGAALHSPSMALSFVTNALLGRNLFAINPEIELYDIVDKNSEQLISSKANKLVIALLMGTIFTFMPCFLLKELVDERSTRFKHQLLLTRLHPVTYWASFTIWHSVLYLLFCLTISMPIFVFGLLEGFRLSLLLLWFLFFWSFHPWLCCASFLFQKSQSVTNAFFLLIVLNTIVVSLLTWIERSNETLFNILNIICCMLIPPYGFSYGVLNLTFVKEISDELSKAGHSSSISLNDHLTTTTLLSILSGVLYWHLLFFLHSQCIVRKWNQFTCRIFHKELYQKLQSRDFVTSEEDEDVQKEREFVEHHKTEEFALCVNELSKYFGTFPAVDGLTFGVQREDCFGLLGVNGAGKTTTFDILSGTKLATSGSATFSGIDVSKRPPIGYCPQFDALPMELTGREVLTLVARLNGFSDVSRKIQCVLECIQMDDQADKLIRYNSGGQRRRISLGLALLARSNFIMLDEPTAGIDPSTRRDIWRLIRAIRQQHIAILLTSHSMDECEALCNRIAFMNRGKLIGIGSSQQLKTRYGQNYTLTITVSNPNVRVYKYLQQCVFLSFEGSLVVEAPSGNMYQWEIPKRDNVRWSDQYQRAQELADKFPVDANLPPDSDRPRIVDFSLTQNSLEQVFLYLSSLQESTLAIATPKKSPLNRKVWGESKM